MEFGRIALFRMDIIVLKLLLLAQLARIFASGFVIQSTVCGADHIGYSNSYSQESFYVNGNLVDRKLFCEVLKFHYAHRCIFEGYLGSSYCGLELPLVNLPFESERKLLQTKAEKEITVSSSNQDKYPTENKGEDKSLLKPQKVIVVSGIFVACCCSLLCPCIWRKRKEEADMPHAKDPSLRHSVSSFDIQSPSEKIPSNTLRVPPSPRFAMSPNLSRFGSVHLNLSQVIRATQNFSPSLQIGEDGFGTVYKAQLEDGLVVAVKRAKKVHFENLLGGFSSEVELLAKIEHRNLVKLLGYIDKGTEHLIVTEYVPNGTLREHLDGHHGKILDFNKRLEISIDIAHGLTYLHLYSEKKIIHRDVKSSNILLTESLRAKVANFGFARLGLESDQSHILTKVKGTLGYLDPVYMKTYLLTSKSDVYSFGILLLEILTGRRPLEKKRPDRERVTLLWVFEKSNQGNVAEIMDPLMEEVVDEEILKRMFQLAIQCAAPIRSERPDMKTVVEQLWGIRADYLRLPRRA